MSTKHCHVCPWWMGYILDNPLRNIITPAEKVLKPYLKKDMTFVDFGCGMGRFSINAASIVGQNGKVISIDIQQKMLDELEKRAKRVGVNEIIQTHLVKSDDINLDVNADFALAMWMLHEVPNCKKFLSQVKAILKPESYFLVIEPTKHVTEANINKQIEDAKNSGFSFVDYIDAGLFSKGCLYKTPAREDKL